MSLPTITPLAIQDDPGGNQVLSEREAAGAETWAYIAPAVAHVSTRAQASLIALGWS